MAKERKVNLGLIWAFFGCKQPRLAKQTDEIVGLQSI